MGRYYISVYFAFVFFLSHLHSSAQMNPWFYTPEKTFVAVPMNEVDIHVAPQLAFYYAKFQPGKLYYRDGDVVNATLNYNCVGNEMFVLDAKGDTTALAEPATLRYVVIASDTFCYDQKYIKILRSCSVLKLGVSDGIRRSESYPRPWIAVPNSERDLLTVSAHYDSWKAFQKVVLTQLPLVRTTTFYFGNRFNHFLPASEYNLIDLFPRYGSAIRQFCKKNKIDFDSPKDLYAVVSFIEKLG